MPPTQDGSPPEPTGGGAAPTPRGEPDPAPRRAPSSVRRADLVAVGLVLVVAAVGYVITQGGIGGPTPPSVALTPGAARRLMAARPRVATPATFELGAIPPGESASFTEGAAVPLSFRVEADSRPLVLEERSNHEIALLFPPPGQPSVVVPARRQVTVEDPRGGTYLVREPAGPRRVRLIVFPPDVDPLAIQPIELGRLLPRLTIVERLYVAAPREENGE